MRYEAMFTARILSIWRPVTLPSLLLVTTSYLKAVGLPALQQYWTFGFHQCRWGYKSWDELETVVDNHIKFGIPLETVW
jgi:alpha-glucosidase